MEDSLKKFAENNREAFDTRKPAPRVWERITAGMNWKESSSLWNSIGLWRVAALLSMGLSLFLFLNRPMADRRLSSAQQDFGDVELFYKTQISEKVAFITNEGEFTDDSFTQDLQKLEAMYSVLYDELKKHPSEKVKDALVLNMLVRIDLLNQQIQKLEETKKQKDTPSSI